MTPPTFPIIKCSGNPREVGLAHGKQAKELVVRSIQAYQEIFMEMAGLDWNASLAIAEEFLPLLPLRFVEEMEGIAEAAEVPLLHIVALNVRSEIALTAPLDGCTAFSLATDKGQWLSQNWDWRPSVRPFKLSQSSQLLSGLALLFQIMDSLIILDIARNGARPAMKFGEF
ncbi:hypothetical protein P7C70_g6845, partial [Phenoliferia sp. Uapishka_3]